MINASLTEIYNALKNKAISATELTELFLTRIEKFNTKLNCVITVNREQALNQAKKCDEQLNSHHNLSLLGLPILHKDIFCTKDVLTTCGSKMLANFIAPYNATIVQKLDDAGTVMLGKANMDEFAMGSSNENSYFGSVSNPWELSRVAGGSSGGSAAAVAARLVPASTGSDTGGSIRQPASLCGVTGIKPTYGTVSRYGMIAYASSLDQAGPIAKSAEDCALLLNIMSGYDKNDSTSVEKKHPDFTTGLNQKINGLKIGVPKQFIASGLEAEVADKIYQALQFYQKLGAHLVELDMPALEYSIPAYYIIAPAECSSNLARYDGIRYGYRTNEYLNLDDFYKKTRGEGFGSEVKRRIMLGTYALSAGYYDAYYSKAQKIRTLIANEFLNAFEKVDVIMGPTSPFTAFKIGEKINDPISMYLSDIYTIAVNLAGLPGLSIPVGFANSLPVGLQIIGKHFDESKILNVAHQYQLETNWHQLVPNGFE